MKKYYFLLAAAVATLAFSCAKEQEQENEPVPAKDKTGKVTIVVSNPGALDTKVSLTEADDKKSMLLKWEETDALSINGEEFSIDWNSLSGKGKTAEFSGDDPGDGPYTIVYPASLSNAEGFNARSYTSQSQDGNSVTTDLVYNAMLSGVDTYNNIEFNSNWATGHSGSLAQNGVIQMRLKLPEGASQPTSVKLLASSAVFPSTNDASSAKVKEQNLTLSNVTLPENRILEAYMMFSAAGVTFTASDVLNVIVETSDNLYYRTIDIGSLEEVKRTWVGGQQYTLQCVMSPNSFEIHNASELEEFCDGVNSGDFLWQHKHVTLANDIDCSSIASWTPIGNGEFDNSAYTVSGNSFKGTFDGANHVLQNFMITGTDINAPYGLFGVLDGATVKNFTFGAAEGDNGYFKVTPTGVMAAGIVAGVARSSTIQNVTNYRPMSIEENSSNSAAYFGMVGYLLGTTDGKTVLDNVDNHGDVTADTGNNSANGALGFQVAGIAGFSYTNNSSVKNELKDCDNHGDLTTSTGRVAGILAAAASHTIFDTCINRGDIANSGTNARIGGITVIMSNGCSMTSCSNYGNIVASNSQTNLGGLVCLLSTDSNITVSGGGNHGLIVGDQSTYRGTLIANINTFKSVDGLIAGGAVANYNSGNYSYPAVITADNYMTYIGKIRSGNESKVTNITFEEWDDYPHITKITSANDLLDFAAAVNNGSFASTDKAILMNDIDCSSISTWTPIGNGTINSGWAHSTLSTTGPEFLGTFDGRGYSIKNLSMSLTSSSNTLGCYGFFGIIGDGATVKNLKFDSTCSVTISASYGSCFGTLAGLVKGATIQGIDNYAPLSGGGTDSLPNNTAAGRTMVGAIVGEVHPNTVAANLTNLHNYASIGTSSAYLTRGGNAGNGANGFHLGGVAGFSSNNGSNTLVTFSSCINDGDIFTNAGRSSGIVAAANRSTKLVNCINNGDMTSSATSSRLANITCIAGSGSELDGCKNYGDLIAVNNASVAGVVGLINAAINVKGCASINATIKGKNVQIPGPQTNSNYNGVLFGTTSSYAVVFSNCSVSGVFGTSSNTVTLDAENYMDYIGVVGTQCTTATNANITFATE